VLFRSRMRLVTDPDEQIRTLEWWDPTDETTGGKSLSSRREVAATCTSTWTAIQTRWMQGAVVVKREDSIMTSDETTQSTYRDPEGKISGSKGLPYRDPRGCVSGSKGFVYRDPRGLCISGSKGFVYIGIQGVHVSGSRGRHIEIQRLVYRDPQAWDLDPEVWDLDPEVPDLDPEAWDLDPEVWDPDPEVPDLDPETWDLDPEVWDPDPEVRDPDLERPNEWLSGVLRVRGRCIFFHKINKLWFCYEVRKSLAFKVSKT